MYLFVHHQVNSQCKQRSTHTLYQWITCMQNKTTNGSLVCYTWQSKHCVPPPVNNTPALWLLLHLFVLSPHSIHHLLYKQENYHKINTILHTHANEHNLVNNPHIFKLLVFSFNHVMHYQKMSLICELQWCNRNIWCVWHHKLPTGDLDPTLSDGCRTLQAVNYRCKLLLQYGTHGWLNGCKSWRVWVNEPWTITLLPDMR